MAIAIHAVILVALSVWYVAKEKAQRPEQSITLSPVQPKEAELPLEDIAPVEIVRNKIPDNLDQEIVSIDEYISTTAESPLEDATRDPGDPTSDSEIDLGDSTAGGAIGVGKGSRRGEGVDAIWGLRMGKRKHGDGPGRETTKSEKLVLEGLTWLARHQAADGAWAATRLHERCTGEGCVDRKAVYHDLYDEGTTALAVLCFLGAGYSHESKQWIKDPVDGKRYRVGEVVKEGLTWLVARQQSTGQFSKDKAFLYNEALATMAVAEAYGLTRNAYWKGPAQRGVDFVQRAQRPNPSGEGLWGWRYEPRSEVEDLRTSGTGEGPSKAVFDADTSVTTWCVMALKSAELAGLAVDRRSMDGALAFVQWVTADNGLVGYIDPKAAGATVTGKNDHFKYHPAVMSALGMCSRAFIAHDPNDPVLELSAKQVSNDLPAIAADRLSIDYYYWYYGSIALNQFDGPDSPRKTNKHWGPWNKAMLESLASLQNTAPAACTRGGWITPDRWSYAGGPVYSTALAVLTLEVYYRYANAFAGVQRAR